MRIDSGVRRAAFLAPAMCWFSACALPRSGGSLQQEPEVTAIQVSVSGGSLPASRSTGRRARWSPLPEMARALPLVYRAQAGASLSDWAEAAVGDDGEGSAPRLPDSMLPGTLLPDTMLPGLAQSDVEHERPSGEATLYLLDDRFADAAKRLRRRLAAAQREDRSAMPGVSFTLELGVVQTAQSSAESRFVDDYVFELTSSSATQEPLQRSVAERVGVAMVALPTGRGTADLRYVFELDRLRRPMPQRRHAPSGKMADVPILERRVHRQRVEIALGSTLVAVWTRADGGCEVLCMDFAAPPSGAK